MTRPLPQPMSPEPETGGERDGDTDLRDLVLEAGPVAQIVLDAEQRLTVINQSARRLMGLGAADIGRTLKDLAVSYRPFDLRSAVERASIEREPLTLDAAEVGTKAGSACLVEVDVAPLVAGDRYLGTALIFADVTARCRLQEELEASRGELEASYEELQSTVEELETTNEELQTTNEELRIRSLELYEVNGFLETILTSLGTSVVAVDRDQRVEVWNAHSQEMWGLRSDETVGEHLLSLDFGLPTTELGPVIRACLAGELEREEMMLEAVNRRGRAFQCVVRVVAMRSSADEVGGAILLIRDGRSPNGD